FTSEDYKDIKEGDIVYVVHLDNFIISEPVITKTNFNTYHRSTTKIFSNKLNAIQFILYNKPVLTLSDLTQAGMNQSNSNYGRLVNIVKQRICDYGKQ